ncbi:MAG TPA: glycosyltransferase, partial [Geminicoccaceae bacterium]
MPQVYDIALIGDFRFPGGTSSSVAEEIRANAGAGYRTALVHVEATNLSFPFPVNPRIRSLIDEGLADLHDPDRPLEARLAEVHNPYTLLRLPHPNLRIRAGRRLLIAHHPPLDAAGQPYYDAGLVDLHAGEVLGGAVDWAPVGPKVRAQLNRLERPPALTPSDWYDVFDPSMWEVARDPDPGRPPVIGRHSRPDARKWPETRDAILAAYPDDPRIRVRILGGGPFLVERVGLLPRNWEVLPFGAEPPEEFLRRLDFFVYFHSERWVEAFGCTIGEALASGAVVLLPPDFEELFGPGALYLRPEEVRETVLRLHADPEARRRQGEAGRALVEERFSHAAHRARVAALIGPPEPRAAPSGWLPRAVEVPSKRVLFLSSNGVGMGHLTRLLAIARRLPDELEPVFATMSQAVRIVRDAGYLTEYLPYHQYLGCDVYQWNRHLRGELDEIIAFYDARVVVADFNSPFQGVVDVAADQPGRWFVWCRRGMWRPGVGSKFIAREAAFDMVLEPVDLAGAFDAGLTTRSRDRTRTVPPIRLLDRGEILPREIAQRELDLEADRPAVIFMLGSGNNYDYSTVRHLALEHLAARADVQVVVAEWLMSEHPLDLPDGVIRLQRFPLSRWFHAFDAAVSAVGYNSFHELLAAGVPTLFVPNENPQQDDQLARARWAERHGLGFCLRANEIYRL